MEKTRIPLLFLLSISPFLHGLSTSSSGTDDGSEQWGYVEVRPKANLFWWLYKSPYRVEDPSKPWPTVLWLQGGPGGSGVGFGNFLEIGPLDQNLDPRNATWLKKADLLFVDSPVGTGFSYAEDDNTTLYVTTDEEAATDLTTLLKVLFNPNQALQQSPLFIFAESYGGKFAVTLGLSALKAIDDGDLKLQLGGIALGDSWISPEDFSARLNPFATIVNDHYTNVFLGALLKDLSRMDEVGLNQSNRVALQIQQQIAQGKFEDATKTWRVLESVVSIYSNNVDLYNFLLDSANDPVDAQKAAESSEGLPEDMYYSGYLRAMARHLLAKTKSTSDSLPRLMNGPIRDKLKIIPKNVLWEERQGVFSALAGDFMKPRIAEVDELLAKGVNLTIYNGQLDIICATRGVEAWLNKLKWDGLKSYLSSGSIALYCGEDRSVTKGFVRSYKNLFFYKILGAGHFVPADQPCVSLKMVGQVTRSPNHDAPLYLEAM